MVNHWVSVGRRAWDTARMLWNGEATATGAEPTSRGTRWLHFWMLVCRSFDKNRCPLRASALAYTTLLALVPLLAVVISVSTSLLKKEGEKPIEQFIDQMVSNIAPQLNLAVNADDAAGAAKRQAVVQSIKNYIANIQSGALGATGMISLVLIAIMLLITIEATFNDIWGVAHGRAWASRVANYWAAITLGPIVLVLVIGVTSGPHLQATQAFVTGLPMTFQTGFYLVFALLPFVLLPCAFTAFYQFMPNTKVQFKAALVGGIVGGFLWQFNNMFNVIYVSNVVSYSKIYGSFGVVPIFLIGMYLSWMILLFGAQVAYTFQNRKSYLQEIQTDAVNQRGREFVLLRLMTSIAQRFQGGKPATTASELGEELGVPPRLATQLLQTMVQAGLLTEVSGQEVGYTPSRPLNRITAADILTALRTTKGQELDTLPDEAREVVRRGFATIVAAESDTASSLSLQSLVDQTSGGPIPVSSPAAEERPSSSTPSVIA